MAAERLPASVARLDSTQQFVGDQSIQGNLTVAGSRATLDLSDGFVAKGQLNAGLPPMEGSGVRFSWHPAKGAIRAGQVTGIRWDDVNTGYYSAAFGQETRASGDQSFAAGYNSVAVNGKAMAMGDSCNASGYASVALGHLAHTNSKSGSFVFADYNNPGDDNPDPTLWNYFRAPDLNTFNDRARGGVNFYTSVDLSTGATLSPGGGSWNSLSDRNAKTNIQPVDAARILEGVLGLPIATWNYKTQDAEVRHIGPMAQDFHARFQVGEDDRHITQVDPDGVALAAIQGLNAKLEKQNEELKQENQEMREQMKTLEERLARLEAAMGSAGSPRE